MQVSYKNIVNCLYMDIVVYFIPMRNVAVYTGITNPNIV